MKVRGQVALVTGGSRGIGRGIALGLAREGALVAVNYTAHPKAARDVTDEIAAMGGEGIAVKADVARRPDVEQMVKAVVKAWGRIDLCVSNAGVIAFKDFFATSERDWDRTQAVNLKGAFLVGQAVARQMVRQGDGGNIIYINSDAGIKPNARFAAYAAAKAGQLMLMKSMALALGPRKIRVNAVLPFAVPTDLNRKYVGNPKIRRELIAGTPLGIMGAPEDVFQAVLYLASREARWVTGCALALDGGWTLT